MQHRARTVAVLWRRKPPLRRPSRFPPLRGLPSIHRAAAGAIGIPMSEPHCYIVQSLEPGVDPQPP